MVRHIDPCVDYAFIRIMSDPEILLDFITRVFEKQDVQIKSVTIKNPIQNRNIADDKLSIADLLALDHLGRTIQIEIQLIVDVFLPARILFTWALNYTKSINKGTDYDQLQPTYSIWVLGGKMIDNTYAHHNFALYDEDRKVKLTDQLSIHTLELPKCPPKRKIESGLDRWIYFFEHGREFDPGKPPEELQTPVMQKVFKVLQEISQEEKEYLIYRNRLDAQMQAGARQNYEKRLLESLETSKQQTEAEKRKTKVERQRADAEKRKAEVERQRADAEKRKAEVERQRADAETRKAEAERQRADAEKQKADAAEQQMKALVEALLKKSGGELPEDIQKIL
ncbi:MAG: Rpn family recombination-promoting nuclease/putative transposase [Acidobacteriota bacterium]|nr:Rpn family recombination-promoting nuclease/putative transposase [Acidobacteriota bacterium]